MEEGYSDKNASSIESDENKENYSNRTKNLNHLPSNQKCFCKNLSSTESLSDNPNKQLCTFCSNFKLRSSSDDDNKLEEDMNDCSLYQQKNNSDSSEYCVGQYDGYAAQIANDTDKLNSKMDYKDTCSRVDYGASNLHDTFDSCSINKSTKDEINSTCSKNSEVCDAVNTGALYNWQSSLSTIKERFYFLFNNDILSDVCFKVGRGECMQLIPAHKFILSSGSAVFDAMFNGKLATTQNEVQLPDIEPQAFLTLLRFLYSDEVQIGPETVMTVLYTAKKYAVRAMERHCVEFLRCHLSPDNAFMLLTQARLFDEPQLALLCLDTIDKNTSEALSADGFTDIDCNTLCQVLQRDTLRIKEAKLFQAVVRWAESECVRQGLRVTSDSKREVLSKVLSLIRFPLMTLGEFAQGPAQSDILNDKETVQLFLYFTVNPKPSIDFLDVPRCYMTGKEQTVCRFQQIGSRWGYSGASDGIRFIVDYRIFVLGFGMYGSIHGPSTYDITIQIIHTVTGKVCNSNDCKFTSDGSMNTFRILFKEPVEVLPNTNYTLYATLKVLYAITVVILMYNLEYIYEIERSEE